MFEREKRRETSSLLTGSKCSRYWLTDVQFFGFWQADIVPKFHGVKPDSLRPGYRFIFTI